MTTGNRRGSRVRSTAPAPRLVRARRLAGRSPLASAGVVIVSFVVVAALAAPILATSDPIEQDLSSALKPPFWMADGSIRYPLGTDHLGRDVYSRLVYGARISLAIGVLAALLGGAVGVAAGLVAGYAGGRVGAVIMRIADLNLAFPLILLALAVVALLGANLKNLIIVMTITTWMIYARVVRALTLSLRELDFVHAIRALGAHDARIIARHVAPNALPAVVVIWTLEVARVVLMESALSFLGLGVPPPTPDLGPDAGGGARLPDGGRVDLHLPGPGHHAHGARHQFPGRWPARSAGSAPEAANVGRFPHLLGGANRWRQGHGEPGPRRSARSRG